MLADSNTSLVTAWFFINKGLGEYVENQYKRWPRGCGLSQQAIELSLDWHVSRYRVLRLMSPALIGRGVAVDLLKAFCDWQK